MLSKNVYHFPCFAVTLFILFVVGVVICWSYHEFKSTLFCIYTIKGICSNCHSSAG